MKTKNGMTIEIDPTISNSYASMGYSQDGDGWMKMTLSPEDACDLMKEVFAASEEFETNFQTFCLKLCIRYVDHQGYTIRKAGC